MLTSTTLQQHLTTLRARLPRATAGCCNKTCLWSIYWLRMLWECPIPLYAKILIWPRMPACSGSGELSICPLQLGKTLALTLLREIVAADRDGSFFQAVHQTGLPERIAQDLEKASQRQLLQASIRYVPHVI